MNGRHAAAPAAVDAAQRPATHAIRFARIFFFTLLSNMGVLSMVTGGVPWDWALFLAAVVAAAETAYRLIWPTPASSPLEPSSHYPPSGPEELPDVS